MKTIWKIYDKEKKKVLEEKNYRTSEEAEEGRQKIIRVRLAARQSYDLEVIESGHVINHNDIYNLKCDLDRLDHFKLENDTEKSTGIFGVNCFACKRIIERRINS